MKDRNLIIVGDSAFAEIACEYFEKDTSYSVSCFSVNQDFLIRKALNGKPVVPFEEIEKIFPPDTHDIFVAVVYTQLNRLRASFTSQAKEKGYKLASYISPSAFVWPNARIGEHCFIFEGNTIQPFVKIGDDVVLWSGNHIGHHSIIGNHCFVSSQVVISGFCEIGEYSFLGVNSTIANNVIIGKDSWIGPSVTVTRSIDAGSLLQVPEIAVSKVSTYRFFKIPS